MPIVSVDALDTAGFYADRRPDTLPAPAFTDAANVRFGYGGVSAMTGEFPVYQAPSVEPHFALQFRNPDDTIGWLYCGLAKIKAMKGATEYNLTRQTAAVDVDYAAVATSRWSGGMLNNVIVLNNGVDLPQSWNANTAARASDLANWPTTWRAQCIRPFRNYLLALDVTESSTHYPTRLRWSHPADPGTVPTSWDSTDETVDAGEIPVGNSFGKLVDAVPLRDSVVLYKEDSVHLLTYIGGTFIFKLTGLFQTFGIPTRDCAVEFKPGQHVVFTGSDLLVHDGQTSQSLLEGRAKRWLARLDKNHISQCFVVADPQNEEVLFCYPNAEGIGSGGLVQEAIVWNWRLNVLSYRALRNTNFIAPGFFDESMFLDDAWNSASGVWNTDTVPWDLAGAFIGTRQLMYCKSTPTLELGNFGYNSAGSALNFTVERSGVGFPMKQGKPPDVTSMKFLRAVWPRFSGETGKVVRITLGGQLEIDRAVVWRPAVLFTIGVDRKVNCAISARSFSVKIESFDENGFEWSMLSLDFDVSQAGTY